MQYFFVTICSWSFNRFYDFLWRRVHDHLIVFMTSSIDFFDDVFESSNRFFVTFSIIDWYSRSITYFEQMRTYSSFWTSCSIKTSRWFSDSRLQTTFDDNYCTLRSLEHRQREITILKYKKDCRSLKKAIFLNI